MPRGGERFFRMRRVFDDLAGIGRFFPRRDRRGDPSSGAADSVKSARRLNVFLGLSPLVFNAFNPFLVRRPPCGPSRVSPARLDRFNAALDVR